LRSVFSLVTLYIPVLSYFYFIDLKCRSLSHNCFKRIGNFGKPISPPTRTISLAWSFTLNQGLSYITYKPFCCSEHDMLNLVHFYSYCICFSWIFVDFYFFSWTLVDFLYFLFNYPLHDFQCPKANGLVVKKDNVVSSAPLRHTALVTIIPSRFPSCLRTSKQWWGERGQHNPLVEGIWKSKKNPGGVILSRADQPFAPKGALSVPFSAHPIDGYLLASSEKNLSDSLRYFHKLPDISLLAEIKPFKIKALSAKIVSQDVAVYFLHAKLLNFLDT
jgi:hypothetical protein